MSIKTLDRIFDFPIAKSNLSIIKRNANLSDSIRISQENEGKLPTLGDFIKELSNNELYKDKETRSWYWLSGKGLKLNGYCKINYDSCELEEVSKQEWDALPIKQRAYAFAGDNNLCICVDDRTGYGILILAADMGHEGITDNVSYIGASEDKSGLLRKQDNFNN
jgi:hypothetical protein